MRVLVHSAGAGASTGASWGFPSVWLVVFRAVILQLFVFDMDIIALLTSILRNLAKSEQIPVFSCTDYI